ncbi:phosphoglycerate dehydrogenase [Enorma sp.]|uniref:phosphoglycerate dehydrogenase n=1 Tax=Enorma sp. TaxID=1920692 RepID=UPI0025C021BB|nr:phosphoglycerate dehydrogenase [Enorma sp.]
MSSWIVASSAVTFGRFATGPLHRLEEAGCSVRLNPFGRPLNGREMVEFAQDADALILGNDSLSAATIRRLHKLKIIARYGVGFDGVDLIEARANNIQVTYAPAANREETADFTFGLILDLARCITHMATSTRDGNWNKLVGTSLYGKTIGIIGVGQIGTAVARRAMGFGMDVLGYDIVQRTEPTIYGLIYTTLNDLLRRSDVVTLHVPLTSATRNMIGTKELKIMKPSAILINTARSNVIRQDALSKALEAGTISAFATDVFEREPPKHMPYFDFDNVLVTPHVAGSTKESGERMGNIVVDNILAAKSGVEPPDLVSAQTLYTTAFDAAAAASADSR